MKSFRTRWTLSVTRRLIVHPQRICARRIGSIGWPLTVPKKKSATKREQSRQLLSSKTAPDAITAHTKIGISWNINDISSFLIPEKDQLIIKDDKNNTILFNFCGIFGVHFDSNKCNLCNIKFKNNTSRMLTHLTSMSHIYNIINQFNCHTYVKNCLKYLKLTNIHNILKSKLSNLPQSQISNNIENINAICIDISQLFSFNNVLGYISKINYNNDDSFVFVPFSKHFPQYLLTYDNVVNIINDNNDKNDEINEMDQNAINELINIVKIDKKTIKNNKIKAKNGNIGKTRLENLKKYVLYANYDIKNYEITHKMDKNELCKDMNIQKEIMLQKHGIVYSNVK